MKGEQEALELQLIDANEHAQDLQKQLMDAWLMGKDRLIVEYAYFAAIAHFDDLVVQSATYTLH